MPTNPTIKIPKFSGKNDSDFKVEAFIAIFERSVRNGFTDDQKVDKCMEFLIEDAANFYGTEILTIPDITWNVVKQRFFDRYSRTDPNPMVSAYRRRLQPNESIRDYYDDKVKLFKRMPVPPQESDIAAALTDGLPFKYKTSFHGRRFTSTMDWLMTAQDAESDYKRAEVIDKNKHLKPQHNKPNHIPRVHNAIDLKTSRPCPFPCRYCKALGQTVNHWHNECPNNLDKHPKKPNHYNIQQTNKSHPLHQTTTQPQPQAVPNSLLSEVNTNECLN
jgi:hypothetical protein